jgi:cholesterol transport system auxiliary component
MSTLPLALPGVIRLLAATLAIASLAGCNALKPGTTLPPAFYALDGGTPPAASSTAQGNALPAGPTLLVTPPHAAAGFDSHRIIYMRSLHKLEYFAHSEWVDPPARMLAPLLVAAIERAREFRAVVLTPTVVAADLRLETEIIRLQHDFLTSPSMVRFTLRAHLIEDRTRKVIAQREFEASAPAASEDPYGGVVAANRAVQTVLQQLAEFCAQAARNFRPSQ